AIRGRDVHSVRNRMRPLRRAPRLDLRFAEFLLFGRMPPDRGGIKKNVSAEEAGYTRRFGIPLVPADQNANVRVARLPDAKTVRALVIAVVCNVRVAGGEIELLFEAG